METKAPTCDHFQRCKLLSVNKEGPNKGKKFWSCPLDHGRCNFFQWADPTAVSVDGVDAMRIPAGTTMTYPEGYQPNVNVRYVEPNIQAYPRTGYDPGTSITMSHDDFMTLKRVLSKYY